MIVWIALGLIAAAFVVTFAALVRMSKGGGDD